MEVGAEAGWDMVPAGFVCGTILPMSDFLKFVVFGGLFVIPFLPIYVENSFFFPFITGKNFSFRIIVEIVFAAWILLALYDAKYRPRFSWILAGFASLLAVMAVANATGEYPLKSFWSNFERMDGYVTLVHVFMYLVVAGSVMTTQKLWSWFFHVSLVVAVGVALYGLAQHGQIIDGGRGRVDSRLGNAAYMAVYMLFHIFIAFYLMVQSKLSLHRFGYAVVALILAYTLLLTGTRGTFLGFVGGTAVSVAYIALFGRGYPQLRKLAAGGCVALVLLSGAFFAFRDADVVQNSPALKRIANIDLQEDLVVRGTIWGMAMEGVKERPMLGWGQGNFNYVFNKEYDPFLFNQEAWFDRVHNIFLDWLIAGGVLGLVAYFSIFFAALYYLIIEPLRRRDSEATFSVLERAVLVGLLAGYLVHNLVVFDNIISYIFYGTILALIHNRVATPMKRMDFRVDQRMVVQFFAPIVILVTGATVYFTNAAGIKAAGDIIDAIVARTVVERLEGFHNALSRESFASQEIVEQLVQNAMTIARNPQVPEQERQAFLQRAELELLKLMDEKPGDARLHAFASGFYRSMGAFPQAKEQSDIARTLSPEKQAIIIEQGIVAVQMQDFVAAQNLFKEAWELDKRFTQPQVLYAAVTTQLGDLALAKELVTEDVVTEFALNDFAIAAVDAAGDQVWLIELFTARVAAQPNVPQHRASLAFVHYDMGNQVAAIATLNEAAVAIPSFETRANCIVGNIEMGVAPDTPCAE